jgi:hypothetical protein
MVPPAELSFRDGALTIPLPGEVWQLKAWPTPEAQVYRPGDRRWSSEAPPFAFSEWEEEAGPARRWPLPRWEAEERLVDSTGQLWFPFVQSDHLAQLPGDPYAAFLDTIPTEILALIRRFRSRNSQPFHCRIPRCQRPFPVASRARLHGGVSLRIPGSSENPLDPARPAASSEQDARDPRHPRLCGH